MGFASLVFDPARNRLVTWIGAQTRTSVVLCDARTGECQKTLATGGAASVLRAMPLANGGAAVGEAVDGAARLYLFSPSGVLERTVGLGDGHVVNVAGQPTPETVVVTTRARANDNTRSGRAAFVVNTEAGTVTPLGKGYLPLAYYPWFGGAVAPPPGSLATRAFIDPEGHLSVLDPASGTFRTVIRARWYAD